MDADLLVRRRKAPSPPPWLTTAVLAALLVTAGIVAVLVVPAWRRQETPITATRELANIQKLGEALRLHAEEHGGKFPKDVGGIEWRQDLPALERAGLPAAVGMFHDPATGSQHRWTYYQGHTLSDPPDTILVAAPFPIGKKKDRRLIVRLNNVAEIVDEADFQKQVAEQVSSMPGGL